MQNLFEALSLIFLYTDLNLFVLLCECFPIVILSSDLYWRGGDRDICGELFSVDDWWRRDEVSIYRMPQTQAVTVSMRTCTIGKGRRYCSNGLTKAIYLNFIPKITWNLCFCRSSYTRRRLASNLNKISSYIALQRSFNPSFDLLTNRCEPILLDQCFGAMGFSFIDIKM